MPTGEGGASSVSGSGCNSDAEVRALSTAVEVDGQDEGQSDCPQDERPRRERDWVESEKE